MSKSPWILAAALLIALPASAEIFKCVAKDGTSLLQNFPCPIDSLGSLPSRPGSARGLETPAGSTQVKPKPVDTEKTVATGPARPLPAEPRVGMTVDEVRSIWGEPATSYDDELVEGRVSIWSYGDTRSVKFDLKGRVAAIQR